MNELNSIAEHSEHFWPISDKKNTRDLRTEGGTDGRTDGPTDGRTNPLIEMRRRI